MAEKSENPVQVDDRYKTILDLMTDGYLETDLKGNITFLNKSAARIYQRSQNEMIGLNYKDYMPPLEAKKIFQSFNALYREGDSGQIIDYEIIGKDGTSVFCETITSLLRDKTGQPVGFGGVIRDVTEKKQLAEQLKQSEESYRRVMELAPDAITITRVADGRYLEINDTFCLQTGYLREEVIGRTVDELNIYANPEDRARIIHALRSNGRVSEMRVDFRHKDGSPLYDVVSARFIQFKGEECILFVA
ncbi:MAG: PAS domain S-box protein, partial [Proteobacteria bacterium]|nr:PAS domain S-box protein [Pseudomonadota bacterium]